MSDHCTGAENYMDLLSWPCRVRENKQTDKPVGLALIKGKNKYDKMGVIKALWDRKETSMLRE